MTAAFHRVETARSQHAAKDIRAVGLVGDREADAVPTVGISLCVEALRYLQKNSIHVAYVHTRLTLNGVLRDFLKDGDS
jgi:hypothetical protein